MQNDGLGIDKRSLVPRLFVLKSINPFSPFRNGLYDSYPVRLYLSCFPARVEHPLCLLAKVSHSGMSVFSGFFSRFSPTAFAFCFCFCFCFCFLLLLLLFAFGLCFCICFCFLLLLFAFPSAFAFCFCLLPLLLLLLLLTIFFALTLPQSWMIRPSP